METYNTKYGLITLYKNDNVIGHDFKNGGYWDIDTLFKLREYIDPNRNILEIGGHCGTSSIIYASFLNKKKNLYEPERNMYNLLVENINQNILEIEGYKKTSSTIYSSFLNEKKIYVYEPQRNMYNLLVQNINQNNLQNIIIPHNLGVFCFEGKGKMNNIDLNSRGIVSKRYNEENNLDCNFGSISLGDDGEDINLTTIDNMKLDDIGFIHCDAEGSENFIFSKGIETIKKCRPVILYENTDCNGTTLYDNVRKSYPNYKEESMFDIKKYCMEQLNYSTFIDRFNNGCDTLLIP
jgi:FkbM family methyltransferase